MERFQYEYLIDGSDYLVSDVADLLVADAWVDTDGGDVSPPTQPDLQPVYTGQFWEVEVVDPLTGEAWAVTQWDSLNVKWTLGSPASLSLNTISDMAGGPVGATRDIRGNIAYVERRTDLVVYRGGVPYFRGRIMKVDDELTDRGHTISLAATDYSGMLDHRFLQPDDRLTEVFEPNPENIVVWEPTVQWKAEKQVVDSSQNFPTNVYRALNDVPHSRPNEWSLTKAYSTNSDDPDKQADLVAYQGAVYECVEDVEKISEWSASRSYERDELCVEDGQVYRAIGDSGSPVWNEPPGPLGYDDGAYPKGYLVFWTPEQIIGGGAAAPSKGLYRARRDTNGQRPGASTTAHGTNTYWHYHDARPISEGGEGWEASNDVYSQGTFVVHRNDVYYATKNIRATDRIEMTGRDAEGNRIPDTPRDPKAPDELSGVQAGWVRLGFQGSNRNHLPSKSKNYWELDRGEPRWPDQSSHWSNLNLKRPSQDATNWVLEPNPSKWVRRYEQVGQFDIAWDLIEMTQRKLSGDVGIVRAQGAPGNGSDDDGIPAPSAQPGRKRDRTFEDTSTTVSEMISEVGASVDGFDWWVDAERQWWAQTPMRWRDRTRHLALVYGSTVVSMKRGSSYSFFSSVTVEGDRKETSPDTFEVESPTHGRWEVHERISDVKLQSTIRERGDQYLASVGFESSFWQMELAPLVYERADIQLGDVCAFQVDFPPRLDLIGLVRVVDISTRVSAAGDVSVSLGCETVAVSEDQNGATPANGIAFRRIDEIDSLGDTIQRLASRIRRAR